MAETIRLKVIHTYICGALRYEAGSIISVPTDTGAWLQRDAPEAFVPFVEAAPEETAGPEKKAPNIPPADKMQRAAPRKKGLGAQGHTRDD